MINGLEKSIYVQGGPKVTTHTQPLRDLIKGQGYVWVFTFGPPRIFQY